MTGHQPLVRFPPPPELRPFVKHAYLLDAPYHGIRQAIPLWNSSLLAFRFGDDVVSNINGPAEPLPDMSVCGVATRRYMFEGASNRLQAFIVEFTPIGLWCLFRENNFPLTDRSLDGSALISPARFRKLHEEVNEAASENRRAAIVFSFLTELIPTQLQAKAELAAYTAETIERQGVRALRNLPSDTGYSSRHLRRTFREVTGTTMQHYQRGKRFIRVFRAYMNQPWLDFSDVIRDDLYWDQSHFIKDFKSYTGFAPTKLPREMFAFHYILS